MGRTHTGTAWRASRSGPAATAVIVVLALTIAGVWRWSMTDSGLTRQVSWPEGSGSKTWTKNVVFHVQDSEHRGSAVYAYTPTGELLAIAADTGTILWERQLPTAEMGVVALLAADASIYTVTPTTAFRYEVKSGAKLWSTRLGDGHVALNLQRTAGVLRVYYGSRIIELAPETGMVLSDTASDGIEWIEQDVEIHNVQSNQGTRMVAFDHRTRAELWNSDEIPFVRMEGVPIHGLGGTLIVPTAKRGICALDLRLGIYNWCRHEEYISNTDVDADTMLGRAVTQGFTLTTINLISGEILEQIQFLPKELPPDLRPMEYSYTVSASRNTVIASFGDSNQTFGISLAP